MHHILLIKTSKNRRTWYPRRSGSQSWRTRAMPRRRIHGFEILEHRHGGTKCSNLLLLVVEPLIFYRLGNARNIGVFFRFEKNQSSSATSRGSSFQDDPVTFHCTQCSLLSSASWFPGCDPPSPTFHRGWTAPIFDTCLLKIKSKNCEFCCFFSACLHPGCELWTSWQKFQWTIFPVQDMSFRTRPWMCCAFRVFSRWDVSKKVLVS